LNKVVARQTINFGYCTSGGLDSSDNIDQAQSWTKLRNFELVDTRPKTLKAFVDGI
jgi:hypothetical protein